MNRLKGILPLLGLLFFSACQKDSSPTVDVINYLPADASAIVVLSLDRLMGRANYPAVKASDCHQQMIQKVKKQNPVLANLLDQPFDSGIDLTQKAYISLEVNPQDINKRFTAFSFSLKDAAAFSKQVADAQFGSIESKGEYQYALRSNTIVAWTNNIAVLGGSTKKADLQKEIEKILLSDGQSSLATHEDFQKCLAVEKDIAVWMNSNSIAKSQEIQSILGIAGLNPDLLKDNYLHHYANFEDGELQGSSHYFLQSELSQLLNLFFKDGLTTDLANDFPADPKLLLSFALNFEGVKQFLSSNLQLGMFANFALKEYGLSLDDLAKIFGGDFMMAIYKQTAKEDALFSVSIKEPAAFKLLLPLFEQKGLLSKETENWYQTKRVQPIPFVGSSFLNFFGKKFHVLIKEDQLFFSEDIALLKQVEAGKFKDQSHLSAEQFQIAKNNLFQTYLDFALFPTNQDKSKSPFDDLQIQTNREKAEYHLKMKDSNQNSLYGLCALFNAL